jgi:hypothetical protein
MQKTSTSHFQKRCTTASLPVTGSGHRVARADHIVSREHNNKHNIYIYVYTYTCLYVHRCIHIYIYTYIHILSYYFSILYLERFPRKKLEIANAPEYSLLGGGILRFGLLFLLIKEKESPAQRARANRFLNVF